MNKYKLVIFDFDGTLFATHEAIIHCISKTFEEFKQTVPSRDAIYQTITAGIGLEDTFIRLGANKESKNIGDPWVERYREIYKKEGDAYSKPFDHVKATLEHIYNTNIPIVVISNKGIDAINAALEKHELKKFITLVVGDTKGVKKKPDPMAYDQIIKPQFKDIKPSEILMVGDTSADLQFAKNIGADACWATYGYGSQEECRKLTISYSISGLQDMKPIF